MISFIHIERKVAFALNEIDCGIADKLDKQKFTGCTIQRFCASNHDKSTFTFIQHTAL